MNQNQESNLEESIVTMVSTLKELKASIDKLNRGGVLYPQHLENCTEAVQSAPEGGNPMAYKRERVYLGLDDNGKPQHGWIEGNTQDERNIRMFTAMAQSKGIQQSPELWQIFQMAQSFAMMPNEPAKPKHEFSAYAWGLFKQWKEPKLTNKATQDTQKTMFNRFCTYFKGKFLEDITFSDVQAWMDALAEDNFTHNTIIRYKSILAWTFKIAMEEGLISRNPATSSLLVNKGRTSEGTPVIPSEERRRLTLLLPKIEEPNEQLFLGLLLLTGQRREEALGAKWEDIIDLGKGKLAFHVQRARVVMRNKFTNKPPKTPAANRLIPISDILKSCFEKHRKSSGYIVTVDGQRPFMTNYEFRKFFNAMKKKLGTTELTARMFRTTYATVQASHGMPPKTLQTYMGHSDYNTTFNIYAKGDLAQLADHANDIDAIMLKG